jgi:superfamily I DNA/RNA helicase
VTPADAWQPIDIDEFEPAAWAALREEGNAAVVAGPGAGKTEFLAQRAAYLLQTGICPAPQRILAISFKRDSAANLGRRVRRRVPEHADRFVSMTFDAFTKGLVDRFGAALPPAWRRRERYEIAFPTDGDVRTFVNEIAASAPAGLRERVRALKPDTFLTDVVGGLSLPVALPPVLSGDEDEDARSYAALQWWQRRYLPPGTPTVEFVMLNRLADLLVRSVPVLRRALRLTYRFVFVDEFQDTTSAQYSFLASVFGTGTAVTVVGDRKQRIMAFAGAMSDAFGQFIADFKAARHDLTWNFRSSDPLVQLQHIVASKLDRTATRAISKATGETGHAPVELWVFRDTDAEAGTIADTIADDVTGGRHSPADFAVVGRQQISRLEARFIEHLARHGIALRNDDAMFGKLRLQDLLKHEITHLMLGLLRLAVQPRGLPSVWREVCTTMSQIHGAEEDFAVRQVQDDLAEAISSLGAWLGEHDIDDIDTDKVVDRVLKRIDADAAGRYVRSMGTGDELTLLVDAFRARLHHVAGTSKDWREAFEQFESADAVALLTAHRSKGLEYHTVFFVGLDGYQWRYHRTDVVSSTSTFFVGVSRAAQRLVFTSVGRDGRTGVIADLYDMLDDAGVPEIDKD